MSQTNTNELLEDLANTIRNAANNADRHDTDWCSHEMGMAAAVAVFDMLHAPTKEMIDFTSSIAQRRNAIMLQKLRTSEAVAYDTKHEEP
jgi:hypothetical protein